MHTNACNLEIAGFEWDAANRNKCQKHGVSIEEIEESLRGSFWIFPDPEHSEHEERFKAISITKNKRHVFLVFTLRYRGSARYIRVISARYMHKREVDHYEKEIAKTKNQ